MNLVSLHSFADTLSIKGLGLKNRLLLNSPLVAALTTRVNDLKAHGLTGVYVAAHWLARQVTPLKKQIHPGWEYNGLQNPTRKTTEKIEPSQLVKLLEEMFQNTSSWPSTLTISEWKGTQ
jgi:hypothetical protein